MELIFQNKQHQNQYISHSIYVDNNEFNWITNMLIF